MCVYWEYVHLFFWVLGPKLWIDYQSNLSSYYLKIPASVGGIGVIKKLQSTEVKWMANKEMRNPGSKGERVNNNWGTFVCLLGYKF